MQKWNGAIKTSLEEMYLSDISMTELAISLSLIIFKHKICIKMSLMLLN
jgi:hypothetical protein